jgi:hypothetical protein
MKFVSVTVAAKRLHCDASTVRRYAMSGLLEAVQRKERGWWSISELSIQNLTCKPCKPSSHRA